MEIQYSKQAIKYLKKVQKNIRENIVYGIKKLPEGDVIEMSGTDGKYRLKVGGYRIIFIRQGNTIKIEKIGPRGDVYK